MLYLLISALLVFSLCSAQNIRMNLNNCQRMRYFENFSMLLYFLLFFFAILTHTIPLTECRSSVQLETL